MPIYDDSLSTGVRNIDDQHKELFDKINNLLAACREGKGKEEVAKVMQFLSDYVIDHFGTEERYMVTYRYPDYPSHKARHEEFVEGFSGLKMRLETEEKNMVKYDYPDYQSHKAQHTQFLSEFSDLKNKYEKDGVTSHLVVVVQL